MTKEDVLFVAKELELLKDVREAKLFPTNKCSRSDAAWISSSSLDSSTFGPSGAQSNNLHDFYYHELDDQIIWIQNLMNSMDLKHHPIKRHHPGLYVQYSQCSQLERKNNDLMLSLYL